MARRSFSGAFCENSVSFQNHVQALKWKTGKEINGNNARLSAGRWRPYFAAASGIVAIVIALLKDLAILELQKRSEVGAHLGSRWLGLKRQGQSACPDNFQRDGISARQFILDFILLTSHGFA